jgi:hypothetical protein
MRTSLLMSCLFLLYVYDNRLLSHRFREMKGVFQLFAVDENRLYVIHSLEKANMSDAVSNKGHSCLWDFLHYNDIKRHWVCLSQFTEMIEPYIQDEKIKADFNDIYTIPLFAPPSHQFLWHVVAYNIHARQDIMEFTFSVLEDFLMDLKEGMH